MIADRWCENAVVHSLDVETFLATSHEHRRWWQEARSDPESWFRDWYVWSKKRPELWNAGRQQTPASTAAAARIRANSL